jgi:hypothetical protein
MRANGYSTVQLLCSRHTLLTEGPAYAGWYTFYPQNPFSTVYCGLAIKSPPPPPGAAPSAHEPVIQSLYIFPAPLGLHACMHKPPHQEARPTLMTEPRAR